MGMMLAHDFSIDELLASSWDRKLANDLAAEIETGTGKGRKAIGEMRQFLAVKGYRELLGAARPGDAAVRGRGRQQTLRLAAARDRGWPTILPSSSRRLS
jgi:hypothetical protein